MLEVKGGQCADEQRRTQHGPYTEHAGGMQTDGWQQDACVAADAADHTFLELVDSNGQGGRKHEEAPCVLSCMYR